MENNSTIKPIIKPIRLDRFYYKKHFEEFFRKLKNRSIYESNRLQHPQIEQLHFIYTSLSEAEKNLFVRLFMRNTLTFKASELSIYSELSDVEVHLQRLIHLGLVGLETQNESAENIQHQIQDFLSCSRQDLASLHQLLGSYFLHQLGYDRKTEKALEFSFEPAYYFKFHFIKFFSFYLYFERLEKDLKEFTLRDLKISNYFNVPFAKTTKFKDAVSAEVTFVSEILSAVDFDVCDERQLDLIIKFMEDNVNSFFGVEREIHQLGLKLVEFVKSKQQFKTQFQRIISILDHHPFRILKVKQLHKEKYFSERDLLMQQIVSQPENLEEKSMAEELLHDWTMKSRKRRITKTQEESETVELKEMYFGRPETGLMFHYIEQGVMCYWTENWLWTSFFGLLFWDILFPEAIDYQGIDFKPILHKPYDLKSKRFYDKHHPQIDELLSLLFQPSVLEKKITKVFNENYGFYNTVFEWRKNILEPLLLLIHKGHPNSTKLVLLEMVKDFKLNSTGFPDLMLVKGRQISFVEVKAEGDKIREDQLAKIKFLNESGFPTKIVQVRWQMDSNQEFCIVDVETTGGNKDRNRITEIGVVKIKNGQMVETFHSLINPERPIPKSIVRLTGISDSMVKGSPVFSEISKSLYDFLSGSIFVAHNASFDYGFIQSEFKRLDIHWTRPTMCTVRLARKSFKGLASYSLGNLCQDLNIPLKRHHRALQDAMAAANIFNLCRGFPLIPFEELHQEKPFDSKIDNSDEFLQLSWDEMG